MIYDPVRLKEVILYVKEYIKMYAILYFSMYN